MKRIRRQNSVWDARNRSFSATVCGLSAMLLLISDPGATHAEFLNHVMVSSNIGTGTSIGESAISATNSDYEEYFYGSFREGTITAEATLTPLSLLRTYAFAHTVRNFGYGTRETTAVAAGFRDIISVVNGPAPEVLRLRFGLDGELSASATRTAALGYARVEVLNYVNSINEFEGFVSPGIEGSPVAAEYTAGYDAGGGRIEQFNQSGWDSLSDGAFTYHIDVPYDELIGGYRFATILVSTAIADGLYNGSDAFGLSNFGHTLRFTGLSLTDGTPLNASNFRFDSGLTFDASPVPEPSTFVLAISGILSLGLWRLRSQLRPRRDASRTERLIPTRGQSCCHARCKR